MGDENVRTNEMIIIMLTSKVTRKVVGMSGMNAVTRSKDRVFLKVQGL